MGHPENYSPMEVMHFITVLSPYKLLEIFHWQNDLINTVPSDLNTSQLTKNSNLSNLLQMNGIGK